MTSTPLRLSKLPLIIALALVSFPAPLPAQAADCTGYDSQIWAQSDFRTDPIRYAALDLDGNLIACEELQPGAAPAWWTSEVPAGSQPVELASITDGDTIRAVVNGVNEPIRLILIDTPETNDPNNPPECYGQEATAYLGWLLSLGGTLYLESDVSGRDRFDRLLRYAWLDFGDGEVYLVNEVMARSGFAAQSTFPPDVKYEEEIREASRFAREHGFGLWSGCVTDAEGDTDELSGIEKVVVPPDVQLAPVEAAAEPVPEQVIVVDPVEAFGCDASYPDLCISPGSADLDCAYIYGVGMSHITVYPPDPHGFDGNDNDGVGCEG